MKVFKKIIGKVIDIYNLVRANKDIIEIIIKFGRKKINL